MPDEMGQLEKAKSSLKKAEEEFEGFQKINKIELLKEELSQFLQRPLSFPLNPRRGRM